MFPGKISLGNKLKLAFLPLSIILSLWVSALIPIIISFLLFQTIDLMIFLIFLPLLLLLDYSLFMLLLLVMFKIFRAFYPHVPDGTYTINDYEYYRNGARHFYYRFYLFLLPEPVLCLPQLYRFFGAKIGKDNYIGGSILDPSRLEMGDRNFVGKGANISGHIFQDNKLILGKVKIEDDVTIGGGSLTFPGAIVRKNSIVGSHSIVPANKEVPPNTVWVGLKPKKINKSKE